MRNNICHKCGSTEVVPDVEVRDYDASSYRELTLSVQLPRPPGSFIYQGSETSPLRAWVCGQCGYTELYAPNCRALLAAHRQSQT